MSLLVRLSVLLAFVALSALGQNSTHVATGAPIVNFRLPSFTPDGHRAWLVRGSEAQITDKNEIDVKELTMVVFANDGTDRIETVMLSPQALVVPNEQVAGGTEAIRVISDNIEATGIGWHYDHKTKIVSIYHHVRVTLQTELKDILK
jgi:LPS export ABC transporter protein LptC